MKRACLIVGIGVAGRWSDDTSALEQRDGDLWARAHASGILDELHASGGCTCPSPTGVELFDDAWVLVGTVEEEDLDADPAVIAYAAVES